MSNLTIEAYPTPFARSKHTRSSRLQSTKPSRSVTSPGVVMVNGASAPVTVGLSIYSAVGIPFLQSIQTGKYLHRRVTAHRSVSPTAHQHQPRARTMSDSARALTDIVRVDKDMITDSLDGLCEAHALRQQMAADQGEPFDEDLRPLLDEYVSSLPSHERDFARSMYER